ncbi:MAG: phosphoadenosine phosphosulfate reductase family protein [Cyanobacteria bacterium P01_A01_bin.116]
MFKQYSLFDISCEQASVSNFIKTVLEEGADLAVSVSGGKDSDAMLRFLSTQHRENDWQGDLLALFCDLGRIEWLGVSDHLCRLCTELDVPLSKLYPTRSMIEEWQRRHETLLAKQQDKPFWSSASARYCTKHEKVQPSDKFLRQYDFVVCAIGLRAEESSARAKKPRYQVRNDIASVWYKTPVTCKSAEEKEVWAEQAYQQWLDSGRKGRFALTWHPIHHWSLKDVWQENGTSCGDVARRVRLYQAGDIERAIADFPCHWAYVSGNTRLSCSLCVLGSGHDILNGALHNPWTWAELALMEITSGWSFQQGHWLADLSVGVLEVSLAQQRTLKEVLQSLQLLESPAPVFVLALLLICPVEQLLFWTLESVQAIASLIQEMQPSPT